MPTIGQTDREKPQTPTQSSASLALNQGENGDGSPFTQEDIEESRRRTFEFCKRELKMTDEDARQFAEFFGSSLEEADSEFDVSQAA